MFCYYAATSSLLLHANLAAYSAVLYSLGLPGGGGGSFSGSDSELLSGFRVSKIRT